MNYQIYIVSQINKIWPVYIGERDFTPAITT